MLNLSLPMPTRPAVGRRTTGAKLALKPVHVWGIRIRLQVAMKARDLAAAAERGMTRLFVEASEPARRFFLKKGFKLVARRDFEIAGVSIHNYSMEKQISR